jgi:acetyl-CoA synthetase
MQTIWTATTAPRANFLSRTAPTTPPRWPAPRANWATISTTSLRNDVRRVIVGDDGAASRSSRRAWPGANWLESLGIARGDRVLLMLGNEAPLWDLMLACIKIGAVMIPATALLSRDDVIDRFSRGRVRAVVTGSANTSKFDGLDRYAPGPVVRIAVGGAPGWNEYAGADAAAATYSPKRATDPDEPLLLYFTSGTTSKPKLVQHSHQSYPVGHLSTMYWIGLQPGDVHWNISSPGWAKHAWSCFFAPWIAGACIFIFNYARFDAKRVLEMLVDKHVSTLCAPPTVWRMLIQEQAAGRCAGHQRHEPPPR